MPYAKLLEFGAQVADALDARSDVFSLGVVLYELATGQHPFSGATAAVTHDRILNPSVVTANPELLLEFEGNLEKIALSGDGKFLAEVKNDAGERTLWVRILQPIRILKFWAQWQRKMSWSKLFP